MPPITSQRKPSAEVPKGTKPTEPMMTPSALKVLLGLDSGACGSITRATGELCNHRTPKKTRTVIDSHIELIANLTQSSPNLQVQLQKLVLLAHCHQHDHGYWMEDRVEAWTSAFPFGTSDGRAPVVPVELQIKKALGQLSVQCIGLTRQDERCKWSIGGQKVLNCNEIINKIASPEIYTDDAQLDKHLKLLEMNMHCRSHEKNQAFRRVASWKSYIEVIRKTDSVTKASKAPERPTPDMATAPAINLLIDRFSDLMVHNDREYSENPIDSKREAFYQRAFDSTPFDIIASYDTFDPESTLNLIRRELIKPLGKTDREEGYIYLYEVDGNEGFVKLGFTVRSTEERHQEWSFNCHREPICLHPTSSQDAIIIPNAKRVETLCQAELKQYRRRIYCRACLRQHVEWYEVASSQAIPVIQKWSQWMKTDPYLPDGSLKEDEKQRVCNMDRFMADLSRSSRKWWMLPWW